VAVAGSKEQVAVANRPQPSPAPRKPFRDNTRLILFGILVLLGVLAALLTLAARSARLAPDFLTEFVLYALSATNLTILVALVFVLARNIVKLLVERRRGLPFARFRAKLVAVLLGMTIVPAVLVLLVGSEVIRNSVDRWFNAPMNDVLSSANAIAGDYYQEQQRLVSREALRMGKALASVNLAGPPASVRDIIADDVSQGRVSLAEVYRIDEGSNPPRLVPVIDVAASTWGGTLLARCRADGGLQVEPLPLPRSLIVEAWASEVAASTAEFLQAVARLRARSPSEHALLLGTLRAAAERASEALRSGQTPDLIAQLDQQRAGFVALGHAAGIPIVTPEAERLSRAAGPGSVVLPSGAGGGDIVLWLSDRSSPREFRDLAASLGHHLLPLTIHARGVYRCAPESTCDRGP